MSWRRFRPIAYSLSMKGLAFPLRQTKASADESRDDQISVGDLLKELEGKKYRVSDQLKQLVVATESETRILTANTCALTVTNVLLEASQEGIKPLWLAWFWLGTDQFEAGMSHDFFVVDTKGERIFREEMRLVEGIETRSHFDRTMFEPVYNSRFSGFAKYWYGRYYQETKRGKRLMLLPSWVRFWGLLGGERIFYYPRDWRSDRRTIRFLLVAILVCLIVLLLRR